MASQYKKRSIRTTTYDTRVEGNVVKKIQTVPDYHEEEKILTEVPRRKRKQQRNTLSIPYTIFLVFACACTVMLGAYYLQQQALSTSYQKTIALKEDELAKLKKENADELNRIEMSINLDEIRDIAINELGMVYATEENVVMYKNESQNYVTQHAKLPQEEVSLFKSIMKSE